MNPDDTYWCALIRSGEAAGAMSSSRKRLRSSEEGTDQKPLKKRREVLWQVSKDLDLQVCLRWALIGDLTFPLLSLCVCCMQQTDLCATLLNALKKCKESDSRQQSGNLDSKQELGDFLTRVPSKRVCPSYYDIVTQPMDIMKIQVNDK